jgi:hypothetical protein
MDFHGIPHTVESTGAFTVAVVATADVSSCSVFEFGT